MPGMASMLAFLTRALCGVLLQTVAVVVRWLRGPRPRPSGQSCMSPRAKRRPRCTHAPHRDLARATHRLVDAARWIQLGITTKAAPLTAQWLVLPQKPKRAR